MQEPNDGTPVLVRDTTPMKVCNICGEKKPATQRFFYLTTWKTDLMATCKECYKKRQLARYRANKARQRAYYERNRDVRVEYQKAYYEANKPRIKAYQKARYALICKALKDAEGN